MRTKVPTNIDGATQKYLQDLSKELDVELRRRVPDQNGRHSTMLVSPDGAIWEVTISNLGALVTTKLQTA